MWGREGDAPEKTPNMLTNDYHYRGVLRVWKKPKVHRASKCKAWWARVFTHPILKGHLLLSTKGQRGGGISKREFGEE